MGEVDGRAYLNCLEGFQAMYAQGVRVFEADLELTIDGGIVLRHDWSFEVQDGVSADAIPTRQGFLAAPILGKYTPLSFRDLLLLMEEHPDICIITDTKYTGPETAAAQLRIMLEDARELGLEKLFDRIVIQIYNRAMGELLAERFGFSHYIYTLYAEGFDQTEDTFRELAAYCSNHGIGGVTMWAGWWDPAYAPIAQTFGVRVYVHTVNDPAQARQLLDTGVSAVYTDSLTDQALRAYTPPASAGPEDTETPLSPTEPEDKETPVTSTEPEDEEAPVTSTEPKDEEAPVTSTEPEAVETPEAV